MSKDEEIGFEVGGVTYAIRRHPKAPLFDNPNDASLVISQLLGELGSKPQGTSTPKASDGHHISAKPISPPSSTPDQSSAPKAPQRRGAEGTDGLSNPQEGAERPIVTAEPTVGVKSGSLLDYIQQGGYVSLYFFLKHIAAASGPYDFLNTGVHLDLANFRQSDYCMAPGASTAIFLARGFAKSTIVTHGATAWEALREPNLRTKIINSVITRAHEFKNTAQRTFDSNPLVKLLYPECVPTKDTKRWTNSEFVMANASKFYREPTVGAGGSTGASEGDHVDLLMMDDLIGMDDVDSNYNANQKMASVKTWMDVNMTALLVSPMTSRRLVVATRYGRGDVYQGIWDDAKEIVGYKEGISVPTDRNNTWVIYYRHVVEHGVAINPFVMTKDKYEKLLKEQPMVAAMQYANNVDISINNEFAELKTHRCRAEAVMDNGKVSDWCIERIGAADIVNDPFVMMSNCTVCVSVDWAGSRRSSSSKSSRTSIGVWAKDWKNRCYRVEQRVGFMAVTEAFDAIFELAKKYEGFVHGVLVEANAMQVGIVQLFDQECERRDVWINRVIQNAKGDKEVRIRTVLGLPLQQGLVYLGEGASTEFTEERLSFPSMRLDVLDESAKALAWLSAPLSPKKREENIWKEEVRKAEMIDNIVGY